METRANYVIVGIFTIAAMLAAFAFVYWTATIGERGETATLRIRIPGSASGLARGSAVQFNGVKVGDVRRVFIDVQNPKVAIADAEIDRLTPITRSTQADIGIAGLTGQANIDLKGADPSEENLLDEAERNGRIAEITANPSAVTNLLQTAQDIFTRADKVLSQLEGFAADVRGPLTETVENARRFSEALAENAEGIDRFLTSVSELSQQITAVSGRLDSTLTAAEDLIRSVDRDKVASIVSSVETFTARLGEASGEFNKIIAGIDTAVASINQFASNTSQTIDKVDRIVDGIDPLAVRDAVNNFGAASANISKASTDIAEVSEKVGKRSEDIDQIIADAGQLAKRLNEASVRVDGVLAKLDGLLGSDETQGVIAQAGETLKAFREVADTLNARIGTIADGLARFSDQGLRDVSGLVADSRRAINRIEQTITELGQNPQRIITGGGGEVREYDGRARR